MALEKRMSMPLARLLWMPNQKSAAMSTTANTISHRISHRSVPISPRNTDIDAVPMRRLLLTAVPVVISECLCCEDALSLSLALLTIVIVCLILLCLA